MGESVGDCSALLAEMDAFRQGFGQPALLTDALRSALLLIPLTGDDRLLTSTFGGLNWVCAFTSKQEYARYLLARDEQGGPCRFHTVFGWRLLDILVPSVPGPTGIVIDVAGATPMAFPPAVEEVA
ncbi:hypothetical protein JOJ86_000869 [Rhodococcus percolatus]|uniref:hypothetical protein n=1 Tax=Rhodococcus opacus TaxID=37919 RepID=UPI0015F91648|nr:hypothetical protein [Rhodococcus opacus]MBA8960991.1 hypothetical protein [Rhodococcus opacus]MBP2203143.1 hypothetical protein [Rhodococcus opacus]